MAKTEAVKRTDGDFFSHEVAKEISEISKLVTLLDKTVQEAKAALAEGKINEVSDRTHIIARLAGSLNGRCHEHKVYAFVKRHPKVMAAFRAMEKQLQ